MGSTLKTGFKTAALLAGTMASLPALGAGQGEVRKTLQGEYDQRDAAYVQKDIDGTLAHYAPDFVGVGAGGKTHDLKEERADFLKTWSAVPAKSTVSKSTIEKLTLGKAEGKAAATVTLHRHAILLLVNRQSGLNDVLVLDGTYLDVWARRAGAWLLTREQAVAVKATMNGKPL